jgi:hypothetical protein
MSGSGGGTNAVQYANGGVMWGDLDVTGKYLSGGVDLIDIFSTSAAVSVSGIPDRIISGSHQVILNSSGVLTTNTNELQTVTINTQGQILSGGIDLLSLFAKKDQVIDAGTYS